MSSRAESKRPATKLQAPLSFCSRSSLVSSRNLCELLGSHPWGEEGTVKATMVLVATAVAIAAFMSGALPAAATALDIASPAKIDNGTVQLGVQPDGRLNAYDIDEFGDYFGLRYLATGN